MSTIKSSAENLTLNADGANNDIKFQSNGSEVASIDQAGVMTATSFAGSGAALTGVGVDGISSSANATAMTIDSAENIGIGTTPESGQGSNSQGLYVGTHASLTSNGAYESVNLSENAYLATAASDAWKYRDTSHAARHEMKAGVHTLKVAASGSADAAVTWNTGFEVLNDGKARAKNGLLFGTDTAAGNTLDDYEEGTFTLAMYSGQSGTITNHFAKYTKIGRNITLNFRGVINNAQNNNYVRISGFPFSLANIHYAATANYSNSQSVQLFMSSGGYFYYQSTTVGGNNQGENAAWLNSGTGIAINVTYIA